jgi:predicted nuclease of predicted toxin-antitoxin system
LSLLFDQNLSRRLPALLQVEYPGSRQVHAAGLAGMEDDAIWTYAAAHGLAIVTKDTDFRDMANTLGPPPKVVWLRVGNSSTRRVEALLRQRMADVHAFLADRNSNILELS